MESRFTSLINLQQNYWYRVCWLC